MIVIGIIAFVMFALGDANDAFFKKKLLKICFPIGLGLLAAVTAFGLDFSEKVSVVWIAAAAVFLLLEIYALFGSFPAEDAYTANGKQRTVYIKGVYAMCRHPGVLFFIGLYVCLSFAAGFPWVQTVVYSILDTALVAFEDRCIFPRILGGYEEYRNTTPFLIPNSESIGKMLKK